MDRGLVSANTRSLNEESPGSQRITFPSFGTPWDAKWLPHGSLIVSLAIFGDSSLFRGSFVPSRLCLIRVSPTYTGLLHVVPHGI